MEDIKMAYDKNDIDKQAEREGQALRGLDQRQNVNCNRNRVKTKTWSENKFEILFAKSK